MIYFTLLPVQYLMIRSSLFDNPGIFRLLLCHSVFGFVTVLVFWLLASAVSMSEVRDDRETKYVVRISIIKQGKQSRRPKAMHRKHYYNVA